MSQTASPDAGIGLKMRQMGIAALVCMLVSACANGPSIKQAGDDANLALVQYLVANPEQTQKILNSLAEYQEKYEAEKASAIIGSKKIALQSTRFGTVLGNPNAKLKIVIFSDYNCKFCKKAFEFLDSYSMISDGSVAVIVKELPILSTDSKKLARYALAAAKLGRYSEVHRMLMHLEKGNGAAIEDQFAKLGIDPTQLSALSESSEVSEELARNAQLAREIGVQSTPAVIIGNDLQRGWGEPAFDAAIHAELDRLARK